MIKTILAEIFKALTAVALILFIGFMLGVGFTSGVVHAAKNYANELNIVHVSRP